MGCCASREDTKAAGAAKERTPQKRISKAFRKLEGATTTPGTVAPKEIGDVLRKAKIPVDEKQEKAMLKHAQIKGKKEVC
jgi:hypothetical protein